MKIAVIGANGYLGKHIVDYLFRKYSITTICYDVKPNADLPNYYCADLTDLHSCEKIHVDVDYIFMFAGITGTYIGFEEYDKFLKINELSLLNLLDTIRRSKFRPKIIYPSSRLVYKGSDKPLCENAEKNTKTIYAVNKIACEGILQAYYDSFDIPYTIFRICVPYGNLLSSDYSYGTVGAFIKQAKAGKDITLYGDGSIKRTFTHIEDLCIQMIEGALHPESCGKIFNIGGETLSLHDAAEIIANKYGVNIKSIPWPDRELRIESSHTFFDDSKIQALLKIKSYKRLIDFSNDL